MRIEKIIVLYYKNLRSHDKPLIFGAGFVGKLVYDLFCSRIKPDFFAIMIAKRRDFSGCTNNKF